MKNISSPVYFNSVVTQPELLQLNKYSLVVVLCDENTATQCFPVFQKMIHHQLQLIKIESGELNKSIETAEIIWKQLLEINTDKNALLINLGGGMVSDIGGFCASLYKRGINYIL